MNVWALTILAIGLLAGPMTASATLVTELFQVTLPSASGGYSAGHVFNITVTYDDAGTVMHTYNDGPNGVAEFGSGDDTLKETFDLSVPPYDTAYSLFSDAEISISGLAAPPAGATPRDVFSDNVSAYYECCGSTWEMEYRADHLALYMLEAPGDGSTFPYYSRFLLNEYFVTESGEQLSRITSISAETNFISRSVPEPATLALLGLGLAGLGVARRRKAQ